MRGTRLRISACSLFTAESTATGGSAVTAAPRRREGSMSDKKILLIDGMSYIYRVFHALPLLTNSKGRPTNALIGFAKMLVGAARDYEYVAVAMDRPGKTFRHKEFGEYKAHRAEMPDDLAAQIPDILRFIRSYGVALIEKDGYEADDIIATLAKKCEAEGMEVLISSGDKDLLSLVTEKIRVRGHRDTSRLYDARAVEERYGVGPDKIVEMLALMGDASDNVPGVPGIGEKWAVKLVREYGDVESVLAGAPEIKNKRVRESLIANADIARLCRRLVQLRTDVELEIGPEDCLRKEPDLDSLVPLLKELELRSILKEVLPDIDEQTVRYELVDTGKKLDELLALLQGLDSFVLDVESTSVNPMEAEIVGVSFSWRENEAWYVPLNLSLDGKEILRRLKPLLEDEASGKVGQNIKYDLLVLGRHGIDLRGISFDTMIASYLMDPGKRRHGLDAIAIDYLGYKMIPIASLIGKDEKNLVDIPAGDVCRYSCEDADITLRLRRVLADGLEEKELTELFERVEMPLVEVIAGMERNGVRVEVSLLERMSREVAGDLRGLEGEIFEMSGHSFNLNSPKQLGVVLFDELGLPVQKKGKTGYSTDTRVLLKLAWLHPLPVKVLEYRRLAKLKNTYLDTLPGLVNQETGRIHASFNQTGTATGRLSSSEPNLQNIPIRTELGRRIREAFLPSSEEHLLISADYSQIDLRLLAHLSGDADLIAAFERDEDIHRFTAAAVFGVEEEEVTPEMRRRAKAINFGIIYGMSAYGLAGELSMDMADAQRFIDSYFDRYGGVRSYIERVLQETRDLGYVRTILGRRRYLPGITSDSGRVRGQSERLAINTPVQGSAADILKLAMISIHREMPEAKLLINLHDELIFEVSRERAGAAVTGIQSIMEGIYPLRVPLKVKTSVGENWGEI